MNKVVFQHNDLTIEKFTYRSGRQGLLLKKHRYTNKAITVDPAWVKIVDNQVIIRNYDDTAGIYELLVQKGVVSKQKRDVAIGNYNAIACKLLI